MSESHLLRIIHRTKYTYSANVTFHTHRLVIRPREGHDLRVENLTLSITPSADVVWTRDVFGNSIVHASFQAPGRELQFEMDVVIRRFFNPKAPPPKERSASPYPLEYDSMESGVVNAYLVPIFPEETTAMRAWIQKLPNPSKSPNAESFALDLAESIHQQIRYERREEKGVQSPSTTLALGSGSCRDMATLMMETLRHLGIAARFASGYLDCKATRAARGSTHAWTEVYFPRLGWRGYDPTTGRQCDHRHIVTGTSLHPRGVMPVTGRFSGPPGALLRMKVTVAFSVPQSPG